MASKSPRLFLAIDNCFASKRWSEVSEWMGLVKELGLTCVEASADNEIDPFFSTSDHIRDWIDTVKKEGDRTGIRVVNCYSGHGTYATLGLGHYDSRVRNHLRDDWMTVMMETAGALNAGLGFFAHAFAEKVLSDKSRYETAYAGLIETFQELSVTAARSGVTTYGIEQMYSPHQVPWTLDGTADFLRRVNDKPEGMPVYITLDTGHQSGQRKFLRPDTAALNRMRTQILAGAEPDIYLGPRECYAEFSAMIRDGGDQAALQTGVNAFTHDNPHLFAREEDGDTYLWLEHFACWSPIIHLQQTDGTVSAHRNFTPQLNEWGIIKGPPLLQAMQSCADQPVPEGFPEPVDEIYLTLEPFLGTACHPRVMLDEIRESVAYWRKFVPEDGMTLADACSICK